MRRYQRSVGAQPPADHRRGIHDDLLERSAAGNVAANAATTASSAAGHALIGCGGVDGYGAAASIRISHIATGRANRNGGEVVVDGDVEMW